MILLLLNSVSRKLKFNNQHQNVVLRDWLYMYTKARSIFEGLRFNKQYYKSGGSINDRLWQSQRQSWFRQTAQKSDRENGNKKETIVICSKRKNKTTSRTLIWRCVHATHMNDKDKEVNDSLWNNIKFMKNVFANAKLSIEKLSESRIFRTFKTIKMHMFICLLWLLVSVCMCVCLVDVNCKCEGE